MPDCPTCGMPNQDDSDACIVCGKRLSETDAGACPDCGASNPEDAVVCSLCGRMLSAGSEPTPEPEGDAPVSPATFSSGDELSPRFSSRSNHLERARRRATLAVGIVLVVMLLGGITGVVMLLRMPNPAAGSLSPTARMEADRRRHEEVAAIHEQLNSNPLADSPGVTLEGGAGEQKRLALNFPLFDVYTASMEKHSQLNVEAILSHGPDELDDKVNYFRVSRRMVKAWALEFVPDSIHLKDAFEGSPFMGGVSFRPTTGMSREAWVYRPDGPDGVAVLAVPESQRTPYGEPTIEGTGQLSRGDVMRLGQIPEEGVTLIQIDWPIQDVELDLTLRLPSEVAKKSYTFRFGPMMVSTAEEHQSSSGGWRSTNATMMGVPIYCSSLHIRGDTDRGLWILASHDLLE